MSITINKDEVEQYLNMQFGGQYSIGIHGVDDSIHYTIWKNVDGKDVINKELVDKIKAEIVENGLNIEDGCKLLSTVKFGDISHYMTPGYYDAGGVIVALPKMLRSESGSLLDLGSPDESEVINRNFETTSLAEEILPNYESGILPSQFILGTYEKLPNNMVKIDFNQHHLSNSNGLVPDTYFDYVTQSYNQTRGR